MNDERFLGVATESWPEWGLNPGPLNYYVYKWSEVIHDTQSAQISQKQDGHNMYVIMKTMWHPGYYHNGFVATHTLGHMMYMSTCA